MSTEEDYTVTERVGKVVWWLARGDGLTLANACDLTGLTESGAKKMLYALSRVLPIYADDGVWQVCALEETAI